MLLLTLALAMAGCTPAGPRALLNGKKYLDQGDAADAVTELKTATTLLATNAQAWNYYGVALQLDGQPDDAAAAYQNAMNYDRNLVEAHFNLGNLWLEQNKPSDAKTQFTAYVLQRNSDPAGWLKLGSAQLRLGETAAAEKSFSTVLALQPGDVEAYNGLGLARVQRGMPHDAVKFFAAAVRAKPDYGAAILNEALVNQQYLRDNQAALENYRAYLALNPRPANWDDVNALANQLAQPQTSATANPPPVQNVNPSVTPATTMAETRTQPTAPRTEVKRETTNPRPVTTLRPQPRYVEPTVTYAPATPAAPPQVVQVQTAPLIVTSPSAAEPMVVYAPQMADSAAPPKSQPPAQSAAQPKSSTPEKKSGGFWQRMFGSDSQNSANTKNYDTEVTPLPAIGQTVSAPAPVLMTAFARYRYLSPRPPAAGDHRAAEGAFTRARVFDQDAKWTDALLWYHQAAQYDPSWFEAQYNTAVLAQRLRDYSLALPSYEYALALRPDATDSRYNFALALKAAGYAPDAAEELKKIIVADPNSPRAYVALGNLYEQSLHNPALARPQYVKALELDPNGSQAAEIRAWLANNPR